MICEMLGLVAPPRVSNNNCKSALSTMRGGRGGGRGTRAHTNAQLTPRTIYFRERKTSTPVSEKNIRDWKKKIGHGVMPITDLSANSRCFAKLREEAGAGGRGTPCPSVAAAAGRTAGRGRWSSSRRRLRCRRWPCPGQSSFRPAAAVAASSGRLAGVLGRLRARRRCRQTLLVASPGCSSFQQPGRRQTGLLVPCPFGQAPEPLEKKKTRCWYLTKTNKK